MNLAVEIISCPGCKRPTHYQWVTYGTGSAYCPECKGARTGMPAAAPYLEGLIYRLLGTQAPTTWEQRPLF